MKCPHCDEEIPGTNCPQCGAMTPKGANYCMDCGSQLEETAEEAFVGDDDSNDLDFENRILCPDGTCTGIIVNGKCVECGKKG
jgi:predicted amidophosphoribosyltransferase